MEKEFLDKLKAEKINIKLSRSNVFSESEVAEILDKVTESFGFKDTNESKTAVAILFQQGGTARACDGNMSIKIFGKEVKLATFRRILRETNHAKGERKLARTIASDIHKICSELEIPGNLSQKIKRSETNLPTFNMEQEAWLSDFQNLNPDTPEELRRYIGNSFNSKQPIQQSQKKGKRKK